MKSNSNPNDQLNVISKAFLSMSSTKYNEYEMEAKFGTRGIKPITKMDYDNVIQKIISLGFTTDSNIGTYSLKIQPEFLDVKTGEYKTTDIDRFRIEILGFNNIQEYCKTNDIKKINDKLPYNVKIIRKQDVKIVDDKKNEVFIQSANFDAFNFRVSLKNETTINKTSNIGMEILDNWNQSKKIFRFMNRVTYTHKDYPFQIDLSIVKSSSKDNRGKYIKTYNIHESNVFANNETYEIEIEVLNHSKQMYKHMEELTSGLQKMAKFVLCGLQKTNYPISYQEQEEVAIEYLTLLEPENKRAKLFNSDFIGPSSKTLQMQNIGRINPDVTIPNITKPYSYCVTEKADGERHLLFINSFGKIYLINTNMNIIFTGLKTDNKQCFHSLLDGELILHNKQKYFINIYASFDIYYINKTDIRAYPFLQVPETEQKEKNIKGYRLTLMKDFIKELQPTNILTIKNTNAITPNTMTIISKNFYPTFDTTIGNTYNIFDACNYILTQISNNLFDYEIDGLIFTPTLFGVGSHSILKSGPKKKITWEYSFKWKPSEKSNTFPTSFNTIDFLVITKKNTDGTDIITPIFENGLNVYETTQYNQYKTLVLAVGFDERKHGYLNPYQDLLDDTYISENKDTTLGNTGSYKPKQFFPTNPFDADAGLCNILLKNDANGVPQMFSEENQVFNDQMVVEFRYELNKPNLWHWIPLRVRYDKTADYKQGLNSFGNDYNTADNNWHSIHNPITEQMIATGENIPGIEIIEDIYYNSITNDKLTSGLRDFHNLYVKKILIKNVSKPGNILIDFACGKAGDLPKWISAQLSFVFGIDISKDNIENRLNGACARFLNYKKTTKHMPYALFVTGNSALNIRSGKNMNSDKANLITKAIFGHANIKENKNIGSAVIRQQNIGINGFDVSSCQFALHYMFENSRTCYHFIQNVAECTKINGYFIATCYDGQTIFNMLKNKQQGEIMDIYKDDKKIWSITKQYASNIFENNDSSLGYKIDVYQDTINQTISEYLVNFDFLINIMEQYGLTLVTRDNAQRMGFPDGSGMFIELYQQMINNTTNKPFKHTDIENNYGEATHMSDSEKSISFLNRYFIFQKTSVRNVEKLTQVLLEQTPTQIYTENDTTQHVRELIHTENIQLKTKVKKINKKIILVEATEALETNASPIKNVVPKKTRKNKQK